MALKATIYKLTLNVSDLDRGYYGEHALTLARHPSENDERLGVRIFAFALHASQALRFGRGLSADDEADLADTDLTGAIRLWIDVGLPDERLVKKAAGRADQVVVVTYGRTAAQWWESARASLERIDNLGVLRLAPAETTALAGLVQRSMALQFMRQDGQVWLGDGDAMLEIELAVVKAPVGRSP